MRSFDSHVFDNSVIDVFLSLRVGSCSHMFQLAFVSRIFDWFNQIYMYAVFKVQSLTDVLSAIRTYKLSYKLWSLVKPAIFLTALPCWCRLHGPDHAVLSHQAPPVFFFWSGAHLLSHIVSNAVPSAAWVLTVVFGMGTGVSPKRIGTRNFVLLK